MQRRIVRHARFVAACAGVALLFCSSLPAEESRSDRPPYVSPAQVKDWLSHNQPVMFVDVREPDEFAAGHLPGALNIPHEQAISQVARLPRDQSVVIYCIHSAHRAPEAARALRTQGFTNVYVLEGGIVAWEAGGLTIQASDLASQPAILPYTNRCEHKPPKDG